MPEVEVRRLHPTDPELTLLEAKIIAQRNEYASLDFPGYQHIYLGFIEGGVDDLLAVLEAEVHSTRAEFPSARFTLEYHPKPTVESRVKKAKTFERSVGLLNAAQFLGLSVTGLAAFLTPSIRFWSTASP